MMNQEKKEKDDLRINWKAFSIIAVVLVSIHIWGMFGGYDWISENSPIYDPRELPVGMANPTLSNECNKLAKQYIDFKNFLGVDDVLTDQQFDDISYADYIFYTELQVKLETLNCSLEPDT